MNPPYARCQTCRFWFNIKKAPGETIYGECHRYPPFPGPKANDDLAKFPLTVSTDWCGEFQTELGLLKNK